MRCTSADRTQPPHNPSSSLSRLPETIWRNAPRANVDDQENEVSGLPRREWKLMELRSKPLRTLAKQTKTPRHLCLGVFVNRRESRFRRPGCSSGGRSWTYQLRDISTTRYQAALTHDHSRKC